ADRVGSPLLEATRCRMVGSHVAGASPDLARPATALPRSGVIVMSVQTAVRPAGAAIDPTPLLPMPALPASWSSLGRAFVTTARVRGGAAAFVDTTGASLSYRQALLKALALGRVLERVIGP